MHRRYLLTYESTTYLVWKLEIGNCTYLVCITFVAWTYPQVFPTTSDDVIPAGSGLNAEKRVNTQQTSTPSALLVIKM